MSITQGYSGTFTAVTRYCDGLRQPCPNPHQCGVDCHFNTAELQPSHTGCTQDCNQGRNCTCLPIVMYEPPEERSLPSIWLVAGWIAVTATWAAVIVFYIARLM